MKHEMRASDPIRRTASASPKRRASSYTSGSATKRTTMLNQATPKNPSTAI